MKKYLEPELEVVNFPVEDIIATSSDVVTDPNELPLAPA